MPVTAPTRAYAKHALSLDPIMRRIGYLVLVAFYLLLQVGEYKKPCFVVRDGKKVPATCTKQFVIENIGLFRNGMVIPRSYPLDIILTADLAVMEISN